MNFEACSCAFSVRRNSSRISIIKCNLKRKRTHEAQDVIFYKICTMRGNGFVEIGFRNWETFCNNNIATIRIEMERCKFSVFIHLKFIFSTNLHNFFDSNRIEVRKKCVRSRECNPEAHFSLLLIGRKHSRFL